jgi:hypothetical protein
MKEPSGWSLSMRTMWRRSVEATVRLAVYSLVWFAAVVFITGAIKLAYRLILWTWRAL